MSVYTNLIISSAVGVTIGLFTQDAILGAACIAVVSYTLCQKI